MSQETSQGIYITQEDIDTALKAARRPEEMSDADDGKPLLLNETDIVDSGLEGNSEEEAFFGLLSGKDIEALLHGDLDGPSGREAQDEVDALFQATSSAEDTPGTSEEDAPPDKNNTDREDVERLIQETGEGVDAPESDETREKVETEAPDEGAAVSQDDIESLISQSDLDHLLGGGPKDGGVDSPSSDPKSQSDHISQDDINRLLKESLDETESLPDEELDSADESDFLEPVILASDEEPDAPPVSVSKPAPAEKIRKVREGGGREKRIWENRLVWAAAAGIVLFVTITAMVMPSGPTETVSRSKVLTFSLNQTGDGPPDAPPLSETSIRLSGFVVLAPPNPAAVAYVTADLTLDFSDAAVAAVIKENEAFVRDIIYGTISSELMARDISAIDEISLELAIRKALGRVVAREAIERIKFDRFSMV